MTQIRIPFKGKKAVPVAVPTSGTNFILNYDIYQEKNN